MTTLPPPLKKATGAALDLIFPRWCIGCGKEVDYLCPECIDSLPVISSSSCSRCGRPVTAGEDCWNCSDKEWDIDSISAPFLFQGTIRKAIHHLKYNNLRNSAPLLAGLLVDFLRARPIDADVIVPVPLHSRRLRERGYNQAELLGRNLMKTMSLPLISDCLLREKSTPPLAMSASREERTLRVANAFRVIGNQLTGKSVLLVDDVSTSGATLNACARILKYSGAASVYGLVLALEL